MAQKNEECKCLITVRVRGIISAQREARETLRLLHLEHTNHAILIDDRPSYKGMLQRVQSYVTWGEASKETVAAMLQKRGRLLGNKKLTEEYAQKAGYKSIDDLAEAVVTCKVDFSKLPEIQPLFKLHPPTKGYKGKIKKSFRAGGEAGYRGEAVNELVKRMI